MTNPSQLDLEAIRAKYLPADLSPSDAFEARAERFYRETGMMAPGKDAPAAHGDQMRERREAWMRWIEYDNARLRDEAFEDCRTLLAEIERLKAEAAPSRGATEGERDALRDIRQNVSSSVSGEPLEDAVRAFLKAFDAAELHVGAVYEAAFIHGHIYDGPTYNHELDALRAALRSRTEGPV